MEFLASLTVAMTGAEEHRDRCATRYGLDSHQVRLADTALESLRRAAR